jgi:hypothetical protein
MNDRSAGSGASREYGRLGTPPSAEDVERWSSPTAWTNHGNNAANWIWRRGNSSKRSSLRWRAYPPSSSVRVLAGLTVALILIKRIVRKDDVIRGGYLDNDDEE